MNKGSRLTERAALSAHQEEEVEKEQSNDGENDRSLRKKRHDCNENLLSRYIYIDICESLNARINP